MRLARYVWIALVVVTGCSKSQMPKGFERLRLGMPAADVVETLLSTRDVAEHLYGYAYVSRPGSASQKVEQPLLASKTGALTTIDQLRWLAGSDADVFVMARPAFGFYQADFELDGGLRLSRAYFTMFETGEAFYEQLRAQAQARLGPPCKEYLNHPPYAPRGCFLTMCREGFEWQIEDRMDGVFGGTAVAKTVIEVTSSDGNSECKRDGVQL